jgi:hypothetical protein
MLGPSAGSGYVMVKYEASHWPFTGHTKSAGTSRGINSNAMVPPSIVKLPMSY